MMRIRASIAIVGDFNPDFASHHAQKAALAHSARKLGIDCAVEWLPTPDVTAERLTLADGVWISAGSPYVSMSGALAAIRHSRESNRPMIAT